MDVLRIESVKATAKTKMLSQSPIFPRFSDKEKISKLVGGGGGVIVVTFPLSLVLRLAGGLNQTLSAERTEISRSFFLADRFPVHRLRPQMSYLSLEIMSTWR